MDISDKFKSKLPLRLARNNFPASITHTFLMFSQYMQQKEPA